MNFIIIIIFFFFFYYCICHLFANSLMTNSRVPHHRHRLVPQCVVIITIIIVVFMRYSLTRLYHWISSLSPMVLSLTVPLLQHDYRHFAQFDSHLNILKMILMDNNFVLLIINKLIFEHVFNASVVLIVSLFCACFSFLITIVSILSLNSGFQTNISEIMAIIWSKL